VFYIKSAKTTSFFRKLGTFPVKVIPISTCYTSGRGTIKISWVWPLHYQAPVMELVTEMHKRFKDVGLNEKVSKVD